MKTLISNEMKDMQMKEMRKSLICEWQNCRSMFIILWTIKVRVKLRSVNGITSKWQCLFIFPAIWFLKHIIIN